MRVSTKAESLGGSRPNPKDARWESVGTFWSMGGDEVTSGTDCTVVSGTRVTPSKSFASVLASSVCLRLACCGEMALVFVSDARSMPDTLPVGRRCRRLARQPTRCRLLLGLGCPASSSVGGGGDGISPNVVCRRSETGGSLGPTSECRRVPQPRWVEREGEREGGERGGR
jgi:hypothetical protein